MVAFSMPSCMPHASLSGMGIRFAISDLGVLGRLPSWLVQLEGQFTTDFRFLPDKLARERVLTPDLLLSRRVLLPGKPARGQE